MPAIYLVTGAAGFIASRVCQELLQAGHQVLGLDNLNEAYDARLKRFRLEQLRQQPGFLFVPADVTDAQRLPTVIETAMAGRNWQAPLAAIINLAARAGVRASVRQPDIYFETNLMGTLHLLELCQKWAIPKFVLASTSSAYGGKNAIPFTEEADTSFPLSPYAASKKAAETLAYSYHYLHGLDVTVLRYFTVYGPAGRPDMSVFRFVRQIAEDEPIVVFGDGQQSRDFTYVEDIARGTVLALRPLGYEIINLGGDTPVTLQTVIDKISDLLGRPAVVDRRPVHKADVAATWANIQKAGQLLGWSPRVSLDAGLAHCVAWYLEHRAWARAIRLDVESA